MHKRNKSMPYTNQCPILFEPLTKENAFLVKVPKQNDNQKDIYFYIGDEKTLDKLTFCPLSRRQGPYHVLKLSSKISSASHEDVASKLLKDSDMDTLIDDNDLLAKIDTENKFNWQIRRFQENRIHNRQVMENPIIHRPVPSRQMISEFKANFLRHPPPRLRFLDILQWPNNIGEYNRILKKLIKNAQKEEHDLLFLFHSYRLISELENGRVKTALQNAIYAQLSRYLAGLIVTTNAMSFLVCLLDGDVSSICFGIFKVLLINSALSSLEQLLTKNEKPDALMFFQAVFMDSWTQLTNTTGIYGVSRNAVSKAYEFVTSNFSFFSNWMTSDSVRYELPPDLVNMQRQLRG